MQLMLKAMLFAAAAPATGQVSHTLPAPTVELPEAGITVPMRDFGGRPAIDVMVNGKGPYIAILDTGASGGVVDAQLSESLTLPKVADDPQRLVGLPGLSIGEAKITGLIAGILPLARFMPQADAPRIVLSAESFPGYLLAYDFARHTVGLRKGALPKADGQSVFEYTEEDVLPTVPVKVGGLQRRVHLDTGSPKGLTLPTELMKQVTLTSEPKEAGKARTHGGEFKVYQAALGAPVEIGALQIAMPEVLFSDVRPGGGPPGPGPGNLGAQALQGLVVTIDAANRRVQLVKK